MSYVHATVIARACASLHVFVSSVRPFLDFQSFVRCPLRPPPLEEALGQMRQNSFNNDSINAYEYEETVTVILL